MRGKRTRGRGRERERDSFVFLCSSSYREPVQAECNLGVYYKNGLIRVELPGSSTISEVNDIKWTLYINFVTFFVLEFLFSTTIFVISMSPAEGYAIH